MQDVEHREILRISTMSGSTHHPWRDVALYIRQAIDRQWTLPFLGGAGMTPSDGDKVESWDGIVQRRR